jgi:PAS domain S-box-containing protein
LWRRLLGRTPPESLPPDRIVELLVDDLPGLAGLLGSDGRLIQGNGELVRRLTDADGLVPSSAEPARPWEALCGRVARENRAASGFVQWPGADEEILATVTPLAHLGATSAAFLLHLQPVCDERARGRIAELEAETALMRNILNQIPDQIYAKDGAHRFVMANRAVARKILGREDPERLIGKSDHDFFPRDDADRYRADERRLMASGRDVMDLEERAVYRGEETWNLTSKLLRRGRHGAVEGIVGINRDVTARRRTEQTLEAERALLAALMDGLPDLIFFKDTRGRFTAINGAYARLLGLQSPSEAVGRTTGDFFGQEHLERSLAEEREIFATGQPLVGREEPVDFPGVGRRWVLVSKVPLRGQDGAFTGLVGVSKDITDRKGAEEDLTRSLVEFLDVAKAVSQGDLTRRGRPGDDTLGRIAAEVNRMLDRIGGMLLQVRGLADGVSASAQEIRIASEQIARGAQRQSEETLATSASTEEMARSMAAVANGAEEAARRARLAEETALQGDQLAHEASAAMARIEASVTAGAERMRLHGKASEEILAVVETIKDFADQTNLLSLNAAIEAARAGAAGAGFNVIADAIRELADKSARAAKDVDARVTAMQAGTAEDLAAMEETTRETRTGIALVSESLEDMRTIAGAVQSVAERTAEISTATREQTQITDQLARQMHTFASIAAQTSAAAEETARTVSSTARTADDLHQALARFRLPDAVAKS